MRTVSLERFGRGRAPLRRGLVLALACVVSVMAPVSANATIAVEDPSDRPIQPGAPKDVHGGMFNDPPWSDPPLSTVLHADLCTMNFVFADAGKAQGKRQNTYIGAAGHCALAVGRRETAPGLGEFGTVVYRISCRVESSRRAGDQPCGRDRGPTDDFALIRVDNDKLALVNPRMRGVAQAPTGSTTGDETAAGDVLTTSGWGIPFATLSPTRTVRGPLVADDARHYEFVFPATTHSGSPVVRSSDGKAVGIITARQGDAEQFVGGPTIQRILVLLREAGLAVRLVTPAIA